MTDYLPISWFGRKTAYELIQHYFSTGQAKIRIATGYFSIKGWSLIRQAATGKHVDLLVGINESNKRSDLREAKVVLIQEIMQDLAIGLAGDRYQVVEELVEKIRADRFRLVDARAMKHHAKVYLIDIDIAIVGSANLTENGLKRNIEAGYLIKTQPKEAVHLVNQFDRYFAQAIDLTQELLKALESWLKLASPWEAYLKTLLALEELELDNRYTSPTTYQKAMIAETLRQIREFKGAMLVASTGLGKTVVATHVADQLSKANEIRNVLIIGPKLVKKQWEADFRNAGLHHDYIGYQALEKEDPKYDGGLEKFLEIEEKINPKWLIIIDESHVFRNSRDRQDDFKRFAFQRLVPRIEKSGCKVLLLTGSPYSKQIKNLNDRLLLLPHTAEIDTLSNKRSKKSSAWSVKNIKEFIDLPVVSQLTTPHVAKNYGQSSKAGISIDFGQKKRFIPRVVLYSVNFPLFIESEIAQAFLNGCFTVTDPLSRKNIERHAEIAWVSSPWALREVFLKVVNTPGEPKTSYKFEFEMPQSQRREILEPILNNLKQLVFANDLKLLSLCSLLQKIHSRDDKVIIFCERRATVVYLVEALANLLPNLQVFGTIKQKQRQYVHKSDREIFSAIKKFAPVANQVKGKYQETYNVFISTDAHGFGINLQDAPVVINYDLSWTAIEPTQRAGRVLRPWIEPRTVELYAFIPPLTGEALRNLGIARRYRNLTERHNQSQKILELLILSIHEKEELNFAPTVKIQSGELNLEALIDENTSPYYYHASQLYSNRNSARKISDDIVSAKIYSGNTALVYVLFKYNNQYAWAVYEQKSDSLQKISRDRLLDWLQCDRQTERAFVSVDLIEKLADACIVAWCKRHHLNEDEVARKCTIYLKPKHERDEIKSLTN